MQNRRGGKGALLRLQRVKWTILRYLQFVRSFSEQFPGFETDIHGLVAEKTDGKLRYDVDCVAARRRGRRQ